MVFIRQTKRKVQVEERKITKKNRGMIKNGLERKRKDLVDCEERKEKTNKHYLIRNTRGIYLSNNDKA
jgi:hypothetical protein